MINIKPGTVISLKASKIMFSQTNKQSYFAMLPINAKLIVLSEINDGGYFNWECSPTQELNFNSLKILYNNKIGYISWASDTYYPFVIIK